MPLSRPTPRSELTAILAQLAPLLQGPVTPGTATLHHSSPAPVVPAPSPQYQLHDLNSLVQQLIQSELHALAAPSSVPHNALPNTAPTTPHDLLQSLLGAANINVSPNNNTNTNINVRAMPQYAAQFNAVSNNASSAANNTASLLSALQTLLHQTNPM